MELVEIEEEEEVGGEGGGHGARKGEIAHPRGGHNNNLSGSQRAGRWWRISHPLMDGRCRRRR